MKLPRTWKLAQQWLKAKKDRRAVDALIAFALSKPSVADIEELNRRLEQKEKERKLKEDKWFNEHGHDRF